MDAKMLREFVGGHPRGVVIKMIDGTRYTVPHRDFIQFPSPAGAAESRVPRFPTAFAVYHEESFRLVNALLVAEVVPLVPGNPTNSDSGSEPESQ